MKKALYALVLGLISNLGFAPYFYIFILFIGLSGLLILSDSCKTLKNGFFTGWWFGLGFFTGGLYWLAYPLLIDAAKFAWLIPFATLLLPALLAVYTGLVILVINLFSVEKSSRVILFAVLWTLSEYLRGHLFTGFPWNLIGYSWAGILPLIQLASVFGIYGVSLIAVIIFNLPYIIINKPNKTLHIILPLLLLSTIYVWGKFRLITSPTIYNSDVNLRIVQANIKQTLKWDSSAAYNNLKQHIILSKAKENKDNTLIIWPESAVPFPINFPQTLDLVKQAICHNCLLLTGSDKVLQRNNIYDAWVTLSVIDSNGKILNSYEKSHLVPFGEYIPFRSILPIDKIVPGFGDFIAGNGPKTLRLPTDFPAFSPLICYEIIFPEAIIDRKDFPKWILNVTNDAWYGNSVGPHQHFYMALVRSVEQGLPVIRAANTGISAIIDSYGRIIKMLQLNEKGIIEGNLPYSCGVRTLYSKYGNNIFFILLLISFLWLVPRINLSKNI